MLFIMMLTHQQLPDSTKFWMSGTVMVSDWFYLDKDFCYFRVDLPHQKKVEIRLKTDAKIVGCVYLHSKTGIVELSQEKTDKFGFVSLYLHQYSKNEWDNLIGLIMIEFITIDGVTHRISLKSYDLTRLKNYAN